MKNTLLYLLMLFSGAVFAQEIVVPDANFKARLLAASAVNGIAKDNNGNPIAIDANGDNSISVAEAHEIRVLDVSGSGIASLEGIAYFSELKELYCANNNLPTLDLSTNTHLEILSCSYNNLETLFIKNGKNEAFPIGNWNGNPNLAYICADESQIADLGGTYNVPNTVQVNSYCTYAPGGVYNRIVGTIRYDNNNNGCDAADAVAASLRVKISNGAYEDDVFTRADGTYTFYVGTGNYSISPDFEEAYFATSPALAYVNFTSVTGVQETKNFCVGASGSKSDVEVVMVPLSAANPGNDVLYKIVYKNKGNQTVSGTVTCNWNGSLFDFVSMSETADVMSSTVYSWNYSNLKPFECREILMTLNLNGPSDTPAVNPGDILPFTMSITPTGDVLPADNTFVFNQGATASPESNSITCVEGDTVSPSEIGNYLHYVVNFENTGTETADFVVIETDVDQTEFELTSLRLINSSTPIKSRITGNRVEFRFDTMLGVADHGNILYKIKTKKSLVAGAMISNSSSIYYGYNAPVNTNNATTEFAVLGTGEFTIDNSVKLYPNPSKGFVTIDAENGIKSIQIFDIQGRQLQYTFVGGNSMILDVSGRASGIYFVKIFTEKGIKVEKLIRE